MKISALFLVIIFVGFNFTFAQSIRDKVQEGNEYYNQEKYEQALSSYKDAQLDDPLNHVVLFNQGDALYKMEKYEEARQEYEKVIGSENLELASAAYFNMANAYYKENKLQESIESYKKALDLNPDDYDSKYNLELVRAQLKEQSQKQQQDQQDQQDIKPSEYAKRMKEMAEKLVAQRRYTEAYQLMMAALRNDNTVQAFGSFIQRIKDVTDISG